MLEDDQVFLHWQERVLERAGGSPAIERSFFMPTSADIYVAALHRWLNANGGEPFAGQPLPARQTTTKLMDRYHSHTINCRSCSIALTRIRAARPWAWALPGISRAQASALAPPGAISAGSRPHCRAWV